MIPFESNAFLVVCIAESATASLLRAMVPSLEDPMPCLAENVPPRSSTASMIAVRNASASGAAHLSSKTL